MYAEREAGGLVIQRNRIDHPRSGANDWESGHPSGPQAITLTNSSGGNVIRYNDIRSTEDHGFNDGFGGGSNISFEGSPNRDSDIYGNIISNCWDDAIESEGANMNVRIWGNYIDKTFAFVATAVNIEGTPLHLSQRVRRKPHLAPGPQRRKHHQDGRRQPIPGGGRPAQSHRRRGPPLHPPQHAPCSPAGAGCVQRPRAVQRGVSQQHFLRARYTPIRIEPATGRPTISATI